MTDSTSTSNISSSCGAADTSAAETSAASSVTTNKITNSTTSLTSDATASSTASATSEERSAVDVESELAFQSTHEQILVLTQLAKQLEYYFSFQNLANDTYLQTLRGLNDGCVPVSILANFSNVKLLLPVADDDVRIHAILQAATEYSELLSIVSIDTSTGTVATDETPSSAKTILSVGPVGKEPLRLSSTATTRPVPTRPEVAETTVAAANTNNTASTTSSSSVAPSTLTLCTTVILRDVPSDVTNDQVRELFEQLQDCPAVTSIHEDVGHCWYVPLDYTHVYGWRLLCYGMLSALFLERCMDILQVPSIHHSPTTLYHSLTNFLLISISLLFLQPQVCQGGRHVPTGHAACSDATTIEYLGWSPSARSIKGFRDGSSRRGRTRIANARQTRYALDATNRNTKEKEMPLQRKKEKVCQWCLYFSCRLCE
jgi:hypothetical protein